MSHITLINVDDHLKNKPILSVSKGWGRAQEPEQSPGKNFDVFELALPQDQDIPAQRM